MHGAEDGIDRVGVVVARVHFGQAVLKRLEQFLAFDEKGRLDFGHRIHLIAHRPPLLSCDHVQRLDQLGRVERLHDPAGRTCAARALLEFGGAFGGQH